eukprot:COSAG01_NODE_74076_length_229_cov_2.200000_1_plen_27_part_01
MTIMIRRWYVTEPIFSDAAAFAGLANA